ncbi:hypothetical protein LBMAG42_12600 [Deltaproteobacteria bacterium]|nr:hypothetical protein LBMAG42_12600 [Deltaproteobacteria bacterium]
MIAWLALVFSALAAVDVNTADATALETLPGIGPSKAEAILAYRAEHGPFTTLADLDAVSGIGPSTLENIKDMVSFGAPAAGATRAPEAAPSKTAATTAAPAVATVSSTPTAAAGCPVNINSADASGLTNLPGVGPSRAETILQYRTDNGPFASCDALDNVSGIGPATLAGLRDCCVVK